MPSTSRRKVQMPMWKEGGRRTSPRISGLNACGVQTMRRVEVGSRTTNAAANNRINGPASRTRARKKRKLRPLQDVAVAATCVSPIAQQSQDLDSNGVEDGEEQGDDCHPSSIGKQLMLCDNNHQATYPDQPSRMPDAPWIPEKRILELILDILQRRDTYEIFAQPVDPAEVEDYYEIIKEPMDFGTMRAKLHEGMYTSLEQFEHDVFLISGNAMHFNSSTTIYFRQARAIHELSKKVFHALKTNPKNFELEFSETRRRTSKRPQSKARDPINSSSPKLASNLRSNSMTVNELSKTIPFSQSVSSNLRSSIQITPGCSSAATSFSARDHGMLSGARDGGRTSFSDADRRCTYNPWTYPLNENDLIVYAKALKHVNQQDIGYRESLMLFARDLGPTAQMIAKRKLHGLSVQASKFQGSNSNGWFPAPKCQNPPAFTFAQKKSTTPDTTLSSLMSQNLADHSGRQTFPGNCSDKSNMCDSREKGGKAYTGDRKDILGRDNVHKIGNNGIKLSSTSLIGPVRELNFSVDRFTGTGSISTMISDENKLDIHAQSTETKLEYSQSDVVKLNLRNNFSLSSSWPLQTRSMSTCQAKCLRGDSQAIAAQGQNPELGGSSGVSQALPLVSQFTFDLPYLKTQLDHITSSRQERLSQQCSGTGVPMVNKMSYQGVDNHHKSSLDPKHTDLVLQL